MQAVLEDLRSGEVGTYDVPEPELRPGGILVRTAFSAISAGTERAKVETSEKSLLGKAMARPDLVRQVVDYARVQGVKAAYEKVQTKLSSFSPLGYSCAGTVIAVGEGVSEFKIGDRVACAGGGYANHCEINWIPANLAVHVPESVSLDAASLTTIGAIAMQGLRQADAKFGETVAVIGAGLVGVLTIQLARAAGCRVIAIDRDEIRAKKAIEFGAQLAPVSSDPGLAAQVRSFSRYGVDAAIVTAATSSAEPLELAAQILRDRGRVVVVGSVGMGVSRDHMYHKEITLAMSRSYGPGRYDPSYEEGGIDYPVGHVRWTERRNMEAFLDLLASGSIDVSRLTQDRVSADQGAQAYQKLRSSGCYTQILEYPAVSPSLGETKSEKGVAPRPRQGPLRVGCVGAGSFASSYIFPNLKLAKNVVLESVASATGIAAASAQRNFGFTHTQTPSELLSNPDIDSVFIASRHSSHASYVLAGLRNGKSVFVEKPLAIDSAQLDEIREAYRDRLGSGDPPFLMVGFNRRFAPLSEKVRTFFADRQEPMILQIRVNAGFLPREHWTQQPQEGGRIIGELCHFIDWARYIVGSPIRSVRAAASADSGRYNQDNVAVTVVFADSSITSLLYLANGDPTVPKEHFEVFCGGAVAKLEDFELLHLTRGRKTKKYKAARDKGHAQEFCKVVEAMSSGSPAPIPFQELVEVTEATLAVVDSLAKSAPVSVGMDQSLIAVAERA